MQDSILCNVKSCSEELKENSVLFSCGHAICVNHETSAEHCLVCLRPCTSTKINLSKSFKETQKDMSLIGYSHKEILSSISCAMDYWNFQQNYTFNKFLSEKNNKLKEIEEALKLCQKENSELKKRLEEAACRNEGKFSKEQETPVLFYPPSNKKFRQTTLESSRFKKHLG